MLLFYQLAQGGSGQGPNYVRLIGFLIIVGFTVLSWVLAFIMLCLAVDILKALWRLLTTRD